MTRTCRTCGEEKPLGEFHGRYAAYSGKDQRRYQAHCKVCYRLRQVCSKRGITVQRYQQMLQDQGGVCAICREPETVQYADGVRMLAIDHDHQTGQVRGLLCGRCNNVIGLLKDSPTRARSAFVYLAMHDTMRQFEAQMSPVGVAAPGD